MNNASLDKRFAALQVIQTILSQFNLQMMGEIKIKDERDIDRILSEPQFRSNFMQSILKLVLKNNEKQKINQEETTDIVFDVTLIVEQLNTAHSREEGKMILAKQCKTKKQLAVIAKHLKITIGNSNKGELTEKIIKYAIGYKNGNEEVQQETTVDVVLIAEQLNAAHSREEGKTILAKSCKTKEQLKIIAKHLKIPIGRLKKYPEYYSLMQKKEQLAEKIIQDTIGYRIDSIIIQEHKWEK